MSELVVFYNPEKPLTLSETEKVVYSSVLSFCSQIDLFIHYFMGGSREKSGGQNKTKTRKMPITETLVYKKLMEDKETKKKKKK